MTVTVVPFGSVLCAHVPDGAASYHDAVPDCALPDDGAALADEDGFFAAVDVFGAVFDGVFGFTVVAVRFLAVVDGFVAE